MELATLNGEVDERLGDRWRSRNSSGNPWFEIANAKLSSTSANHLATLSSVERAIDGRRNDKEKRESTGD